jgi:YfiH family protein
LKYLIKFGDLTNAICLDQPNILIKNLPNTVFLKQTHSNSGKIIDVAQVPFVDSGDFLFTNKPNIAIGVLTADCLPIAITDQARTACSTIHAGWRGTINNIILNSTNVFLENGSNLQDLIYYFGPSIGVCCYEVSEDFITNIQYPNAIRYQNNRIYFDLLAYNTILLQQIGVKYRQLNFENWQCTFCSGRYYSYRKDNNTRMRQFSVVKIL